jgi:hypothetical protein
MRGWPPMNIPLYCPSTKSRPTNDLLLPCCLNKLPHFIVGAIVMLSQSLHVVATFHFIKQHTLPNIPFQVHGVAWSCPLPAWFLVPNREAKTPPPRLFPAVATTHTRPRPNTTEVKWRRLHCCRNPYMPLQSYCLTWAPNRRPPPSQRLTQFHIHELQHKVSASDSPPISMHLGTVPVSWL